MSRSICYFERQLDGFVSLERAFREIASNISDRYTYDFKQAPFSSRVANVPLNLAFLTLPKADIYHITGHINYVALRFPPERTVLSIMDIRFVNSGSAAKRKLLKSLYLDLPVRRMKYITAISQSVKTEIVSSTGCDPEKVRVLDLPVFANFSDPETKDFNAECPTILQIGTMKNKNVVRLAEAIRDVKCRLVIIGPLDSEQIDALCENRIDYVNKIGISDDAIRQAYIDCDIVSFCSTYEGFGLPIIEGQSLGKPVVTSDLSPMKETAGNGAVLCDPHSPESMRTAIKKVIADEHLRTELFEEGKRNVTRFSAPRVAEQYEALYDEIIDDLLR